MGSIPRTCPRCRPALTRRLRANERFLNLGLRFRRSYEVESKRFLRLVPPPPRHKSGVRDRRRLPGRRGRSPDRAGLRGKPCARRGERPGPLPVVGSSEVAALAAGFQSAHRRPRPRTGRRTSIPALRQPRAEDPARLDPWARRGPPRPRNDSSPSGRGRRRRGEAPRAARARPARSCRAQSTVVLDRAGTCRPGRDRHGRGHPARPRSRGASASRSLRSPTGRRRRTRIVTGRSRCCRT